MLQTLQIQFLQAIGQVHSFDMFDYCGSGSWGTAIMYNLMLGTFIYILSLLTTQYSWVDRIWSILPIIYQAHILAYQTQCGEHVPISQRQYIMIGLVTMWGLRLTYNYYRKGGYQKGGQDYRWAYIRQKFPRAAVECLNFFFTSYYQLFLIYLFSSPIKYAYHLGLNLNDYVLVAVWLVLWVGEILADEQQWKFQTKKYELLKNADGKIEKIPQPYKKGFIKSGLFKISRHPNFFCEISLWWVIFAFSFNSYGINMTILGAILLNFLFLGSTSLTQIISCQKYSKYIEYQSQVSRLVPFMIIPSKKANKDQKEN